MSSTSNRASPPGTLVVDVPHWAATVRVFDNLGETAIKMSAPEPGEGNSFRVRGPLGPGAYKVEVSLGTSRDSEWVAVRPGRETAIPASRWAGLRLVSAAPIQTSSSGGPDPSVAAAEKWSHETTWPAPQAGHARLFVFVRTPDVKRYPDFSDGLTLRDAAGLSLTPLGTGSVFKDGPEGWMAFATDLPGGFYMLTRNGPGPVLYNQPVYLCDGWETQLFIVGGKRPSFRSLTINMAPRGAGFRHDDETATAAAAVLAALMNERGMSAVLGSAELTRMLRTEHRNPWLAVLVAHVLMAIEEEAAREGVEIATFPGYDRSLKRDVLQFLDATIGHHPDVRALHLTPDGPAPEPFPYPPMLLRGLRKVQQHATQFADTIPVGSLTDRMLNRLVTSSPWSVWRQPAPTSENEEAGKPRAIGPKTRRRLASEVLRSAFAPNAPIFVAPAATPPVSAKTSELGKVLYDLPVIKIAQEMIGQAIGTLPEKIVVDSKVELRKLLEQVNARAFSAAAGIPLGRAERTIDKMRRTAQTGESLIAGGAGPTTRAVVEFAVRQSSRGRPEGDPVESGAKMFGPRPDSAPQITLEECASKLQSAAKQVIEIGTASQSQAEGTERPIDTTAIPTADERRRASVLAARLQALGRTLLGHANPIAITGPAGQLLYGNGAFLGLMRLTDAAHPDRAGRRWCQWLSTLPLGRSTSLTSPVDPTRIPWTVHRSAVVGSETDEVNGYVNMLDDERKRRLPKDVSELFAAKMSEITLHASFVQHGSPTRRARSLDHLEDLVSMLERTLQGVKGNETGRIGLATG